jgi:DNA-binding transcriptional MerR regulator
MSNSIEIPNKSSFKVSEVCALTDVKSYVLRFWESEFSEISPLISSSGQKLYEHRDIEIILLIKKLLFEKKMTIEEVKIELKKYSFSLVGGGLSASNSETFSEDQFVSMAKNKLRHILSITESLQSKYNW